MALSANELAGLLEVLQKAVVHHDPTPTRYDVPTLAAEAASIKPNGGVQSIFETLLSDPRAVLSLYTLISSLFHGRPKTIPVGAPVPTVAPPPPVPVWDGEKWVIPEQAPAAPVRPPVPVWNGSAWVIPANAPGPLPSNMPPFPGQPFTIPAQPSTAYPNTPGYPTPGYPTSGYPNPTAPGQPNPAQPGPVSGLAIDSLEAWAEDAWHDWKKSEGNDGGQFNPNDDAQLPPAPSIWYLGGVQPGTDGHARIPQNEQGTAFPEATHHFQYDDGPVYSFSSNHQIDGGTQPIPEIGHVQGGPKWQTSAGWGFILRVAGHNGPGPKLLKWWFDAAGKTSNVVGLSISKNKT